MAVDLIKRDALGYPRGLPVGQHPLDHFIKALVLVLGRARAARYLGIAEADG